jgi:hypothetical protein
MVCRRRAALAARQSDDQIGQERTWFITMRSLVYELPEGLLRRSAGFRFPSFACLQEMTKILESEVILSDAVRETAEVPVDALPGQEVAIRGRAEPMIVRIVANAKVLSALVENVAVVAA